MINKYICYQNFLTLGKRLIPRNLRFLIKTGKVSYLLTLKRELRFRKHNYDLSQFGEQAFIMEFFQGTVGFYLDIGAGLPVRGSNTFSLYQSGWSGVCVDPLPRNRWLHRKLRKRDIFIQGLVGIPGCVEFFTFEPYEYSTTLHSVAMSVLKEHGLGVKLIRVSRILVQPLHEVALKLNNLKSIRFISIDVEGADLDVLRSNDWSILKPELICVENWNSKDVPDELFAFLNSKGYSRVKTFEVSEMWVRNKF